MKIVILTTDNREHFKDYGNPIPYFCTAPESLFKGFAVLPDLEVHVISCTQQPTKSPVKLADNIWFHGFHVPKSGWLRTFYQGCIRATRKKMAELKPDIVHAHGTERECAISAVFSGFPNIVTIHGNMAELARLNHARFGSYGWLTARLENFTLPRTAGVLCNSSYTEALVRPRAHKTWLMPHAMRPSFIDPAPTNESRPCALLVTGVITSRKRQLELLDVAEALHRQGLKFEFRFIGFTYSSDADYTAAFLKRIKPMEEAGYARYLGAPPDNELVQHFDAVSGLVHFPTEEAFGNVVVEALARDLKFFGARTGGIVDIAGDAPGAELFSGNDWTGLTDAIARWIKQGHPRPIGAAALMRKRYHPETIARRHLEIYREVLSTRS